ncbi:MAG: hypothetical protein EHM79_00380 [Geobacter sp.]|nr:MAG: hypothetical protein EHM79_00380 [Geobacter sp.]
MSFENQALNQSVDAVPNKIIHPVVTTSLKVYEQVVYVSTVDAHVTITMPPVAEAAGRIYSIMCILRTGSYDVTITDYKDDTGNATKAHGDLGNANLVLNAANEHVILYSDGVAWHLLNNVTNIS